MYRVAMLGHKRKIHSFSLMHSLGDETYLFMVVLCDTSSMF